MFRKKATQNSPLPDSSLDPRYYAEGVSWEQSHYRTMKAGARFWRFYGLLATAIIVVLAIALLSLIPLKDTQVVVLQVDKSTGYMQVVQPLTNTEKLDANDAVTASNIVQFIQARETYDPDRIKDNHDKALLFSKENAAQDIVNLYNSSNSNNPERVYGKDSRVSVTISSLNFLSDDTALVRFTTNTVTPTGPPGGITYYWSATVRYQYSSAPLRQDWRFINPLGFQVSDYRRDQERIAPTVNNGGAPQ